MQYTPLITHGPCTNSMHYGPQLYLFECSLYRQQSKTMTGLFERSSGYYLWAYIAAQFIMICKYFFSFCHCRYNRFKIRGGWPAVSFSARAVFWIIPWSCNWQTASITYRCVFLVNKKYGGKHCRALGSNAVRDSKVIFVIMKRWSYFFENQENVLFQNCFPFTLIISKAPTWTYCTCDIALFRKKEKIKISPTNTDTTMHVCCVHLDV